MDRYFTPSIEDIRVGYECEYPGNGMVVVTALELNNMLLKHIDEIRVPYLTAEQIEKEGWTSFADDKKGTFMLSKNMDKKTYTIMYKPDHTIIINMHGHTPLFVGQCKDINTFRYICKLLNI